MSRDVTTLPPAEPAAGVRRARGAQPAGATGSVAAPAPADGRRRARVAGPPQPPGARPGGATGLRQRPGRAGIRAPAQPGTRTRTRPSGLPAGLRPGRATGAAAARAGQESRTRFVFLVLGLLAGALISLLLINTVLATGSYEITALQKANVQLAQQRQTLEAQVAREQTPAVLYRRARQLGMVDPPLTHFLDLRKDRIISQPRQVPGVVVYPPGYTP